MIGILMLRSGKIILRMVGTGLYNSLKAGITKLVDAFGTSQHAKGQHSANHLQPYWLKSY